MQALARQPRASLDLIEFFKRDELLALVEEVYRVLRAGGRWIIHAPNAESPSGMRMRYGDFTHELAFNSASIAQLMLSSGFSRAECFEDQPIPNGVRSLGRWMIWKCIGVFFTPLHRSQNRQRRLERDFDPKPPCGGSEVSIGARTHCMSNTNGPPIRETLGQIASNGRLARAAHLAGRTGASPGISPTRGLAVNEAMNFGLPVIVPDCVGRSEDLVRHGWNGVRHSAQRHWRPGGVADISAEKRVHAPGVWCVKRLHCFKSQHRGMRRRHRRGRLAAACESESSRADILRPIGKAPSGLFVL